MSVVITESPIRRQTYRQAEEEDKMCWVINLERKVLKIQYMEYKKYSSFTFIDPLKYIFGFTIIPQPKTQHQTPEPIKTIESQQNKKNHQHQLIRVPLQSPKQTPKEQYKPSTEFYKNFLENRNKPKETKKYSYGNNTINAQLSLKEENKNVGIRPMTSKYGGTSYGMKKTFQNSMQMRPSTGIGIHSGAQTTRNAYKPRPSESGYHNASTFEYTPTNKYNPGQSFFLHNYDDSPKRQVQTDRKFSGKQPRMSLGFNQPTPINKNLRMSFGNKEVSSEHQKFYKRVKDILRK